MTAPTSETGKLAQYNRLRARNAKRDNTMALIRQVRNGNIRQMFPGELAFNLSFEGSPIANFVDIVARDMAEGLAPLPALACVSGKMKTDADQRRAEAKNRIGDNYWSHSKLETQMLRGADRYVTYGFLPFFIEPDTKNKIPFIQVLDPLNSYYELDRFGRTRVFAKRYHKNIDDLCAMFPEHASQIRTDPKNDKAESGSTELELVSWVDDDCVTLFLPSRSALMLAKYEHKLKSGPPVHIAERPGLDDTPRGQFDDVIWVQVARAIMSTLALEAASIAVQAPIAVPSDMDELPVGPHALMTSDNPQNIRRVALDLPQGIFAEGQVLDQELHTGARYPDARSGNSTASVITGKGVEALLGTFDTQIKGGQMVFKEAFQRITAMCFEYDEAWWPNDQKTISGTISGASWELDYSPASDIAGRYTCTVTYGFAAGMHPSQSIVTMLQLEGAGLIAKGTTQENLPFSIDMIQEQKKINVEGSREALKQGLFALVQSSGQMAAAGQDPTPVITLAVSVIKDLQNGLAVEDAVAKAYAAQKAAAEQAAAEQAAQQAAQAPPDGGAAPPDGGGGDGLPPGVAPGQAGLPAGGRPTVNQMISGLRGDGSTPVQQAEIRRSVATGT
jgi:hypothetical protein